MKANPVPAAQEGAQHAKDAAASAASTTADQAKNAAVDLRERIFGATASVEH